MAVGPSEEGELREEKKKREREKMGRRFQGVQSL